MSIYQASVKKASRQLNVLKRSGKHLAKLGKLTIYYSFIMFNFNYCPLVWHFCGEVNTKKVEKIQEMALRFIYEDYSASYDELLSKSKLPSLKVRKMRSLAIEVYKVIDKLLVWQLMPMFHLQIQIHFPLHVQLRLFLHDQTSCLTLFSAYAWF
jgi:hypothetical protein